MSEVNETVLPEDQNVKDLNDLKAAHLNLLNENKTLNDQLLSLKTNFENLQSELEVAKSMFNDSLNTIYQLKTGNYILQKKLQNLAQQLHDAKSK